MTSRFLREYQVDKERIYRALQEIRGNARLSDFLRQDIPVELANFVYEHPDDGKSAG